MLSEPASGLPLSREIIPVSVRGTTVKKYYLDTIGFHRKSCDSFTEDTYVRTKAKTKVKRERGTGGLIRIKGCRYWYAQIYVKGKARRISTKTPIKQKAQGVLRDLMTDTDRGVQFPGDLKKIFYGDLRNALLQNYVERGNRSLQTLADGEETIWGLKGLDEFFDYDPPDKRGASVTQITTDTAREFARKRTKAGVTNSTVNTSLSLLRRMLHIAHEDGKIQIVPKIRLLKENPARKGFLAREKFEELLSHMPEKLKPLITFLYYCGVRLGEALQIEWSQVDLKQAVIRIEDEQAKSGEARTVPLPDVLVTMLEQVEPKAGTVFVGTNLRKAWCKACAAAGLGVLEEVLNLDDNVPFCPR